MRSLLEVKQDIQTIYSSGKRDAIIEIMACSLIYLCYYMYSNLDNNPGYPPLPIRVIVPMAIFLESTKMEFSPIQRKIFSNEKKEIEFDYCDMALNFQKIRNLVYDDFQNIGCNIEDISLDDITNWFSKEDERERFLDTIHQNGLNEKPYIKAQ